MIRIRGLEHFYQNHPALRGVDLDIPAGEIFGLLGPNGSGKSTLFRILSTALKPSKGEVKIADLDLASGYQEIRKKIGVVFQSPSVDTKLTARENVFCQGRLYGLSGKVLAARADEMLDRLGLKDRQNDRVEKLSGGLKRRVELAKGLIHKPLLLLLDEPSTGLDPGARIDLWHYLNRLRNQEKITLLVTTHLMEEADHCDRIGILDQGRLLRVGCPLDLRKEVGQEVLVLKTNDGVRLKAQIEAKFRVPVVITDSTLQIEHVDSSSLMTKILEAFPGQIDSVTFRKPTLEDVFIHHTGHRFWNAEKEVSG